MLMLFVIGAVVVVAAILILGYYNAGDEEDKP